MALRFRKSIKLLPGVRINLNKKSTSVTFGGKGVHHTVSSSGRQTTSVGLPGTGLYYTETNNAGRKQQNRTPISKGINTGTTPPAPRPKKKHRILKTFFIILAVFIAIVIFVPDIEVEGIKLGKVNATMDINSEQTVNCTVSPDGATIAGLEVVSSDTNVVTASEDGENVTITSHNAGKAYVYLKSEKNIKSNKVKIKVVDKEKRRQQKQEKQEKREQALQESREKAAEEASQEAELQAQQESQEEAQEAQEGEVYISQTGSRYHSDSSCSNMNNPGSVPLSTAVDMGLTPCQNCY